MKRHVHITTYRGHAIYADKTDDGEMVYMYAKKRNGTDEYFSTYEDVIKSIDDHENIKELSKWLGKKLLSPVK